MKEETRAKYEKAKALIAEKGMTRAEACSQVGMSVTYFASLKKDIEGPSRGRVGRPKRETIAAIPVGEAPKKASGGEVQVMVIKGNLKDVSNMIGSFMQ